jgi:3-deoxy-D-manno-octulosonic-acid transferase
MYLLYYGLIYSLSFVTLPFLLVVALAKRKYRVWLPEKMGFVAKEKLEPLEGNRPIWFHAVSVGEVTAAVTIIEEVKRKFPQHKVVLSTVTATGKHTASQNVKGADAVIFFPLDHPSFVRRALKEINPVLFITLETEIWPVFLRELNRRTIPALMISGRISNRSFKKYRWCRFFFRQVLENVRAFCMQSDLDAQRIIEVGAQPERVTVTGNLKLDQSIPHLSEDEKEHIYRSLKLQRDEKLLIAGSTHRGEEQLILDAFRELKEDHHNLKLLLAPRHPERFDEVESLIARNRFRSARKTCIEESNGQNQGDVILLDTIGELAKVYSIGTIIFVGGSFVSVGGHNILEPAAYRKAVIFGPYMENFSEISRILSGSGGGLQVKHKDEFTSLARKLLGDEELRTRLGELAFGVIEKNRGALQKSVRYIEKVLC